MNWYEVTYTNGTWTRVTGEDMISVLIALEGAHKKVHAIKAIKDGGG